MEKPGVKSPPRLPVPGADDDRWGDILNAYLQVGHRDDGTHRGTFEVINVKDMGAQGDGCADDTMPLQSAIDSAQAAGGATVFIPAGKYLTTRPLTVTGHNVVIRGSGNASVIASAVPAGAILRVSHENDLYQCTNHQVLDLTLDRNVEPDMKSTGLAIEHARYIQISRVSVHNQGRGISVGIEGGFGIPTQFVYIDQAFVTGGHFPDAGIQLNSGADFAISRSFIEPGNRGIVMGGGSTGIFIVQTTVINGNEYNYGIVSEGDGFARFLVGVNVENARNHQIHIGGSPGNKRLIVADSWIGAGDKFGENRIGISIEPGMENITISNCRIGDQGYCGIESRGSNIHISGNIVESNGWMGGEHGHGIILSEGHDVIVQNNLVHSGPQYGILTSGPLDYYIITGNSVHNNKRGGLRDSASGLHKTAFPNL